MVRIFSGLGVGSGANWQGKLPPSRSRPCQFKLNTNYVDGDEITISGFLGQLPYEEDFGVLLLRVGTASLEATGLRGWNNEVAPIALPVKSNNRNRTRGNKSPQTYGVVRMGRVDVADVQYGSSAYASTSTSRVQQSSNPLNPYENLSIRQRRRTNPRETQQRQQRGLFNEVRTIELGINNTAESPRGFSGWSQIKQSWPFFVALWDVLKGLVFFLRDKVRSKGRRHQDDRAGRLSTTIRTSTERLRKREDGQGVEGDDDSADETRQKEVYSRFLRGEEISDDDSEPDHDFTSSLEDEDLRDVEDDDEEEQEEEENGQGEAVRLFSDFLRNGSAPPTSVGGEMVLAHLLHGQATSSGPLTRQGWRELVGQGGVGNASDYRPHLSRLLEDDVDSDNIWGQPSFNRSEATSADSQPTLNTTTCVICTNGERDIICWPCRYVLSS